MKEQQQDKTNFIKKYYWQLLICTVVIAGLFAAPLLTQARFKTFLNAFTAVIAREYYFTSNYLSSVEDNNADSKGAEYIINGWNAADMPNLHVIQIRNYDNALLTNDAGQDLDYTMTWKITTYDTEGTDVTAEYPYTLRVELEEETKAQTIVLGQSSDTADSGNKTPVIIHDIAADEKAGYHEKYDSEKFNTEQGLISSTTGTITSSIAGGQSGKDAFIISVIAPKEQATEGYYCKLEFEAVNAGNQYYGKLKGTFRYNISLDTNFINFEMKEDQKDVETTIKTNIVPSNESVKVIHLWWDESMLNINWFNYHFILLRNSGKYKSGITVDGITDRTFAELEITAVSLAANQFEFEKRKDFDFIGANQTLQYVGKGVKLADLKPADSEGTETSNNKTYYIGYYLEEIDKDALPSDSPEPSPSGDT